MTRACGMAWIGALVGAMCLACGVGCGRVSEEDTASGLFVWERTNEPAVLLLLHGDYGDRRCFSRLRELKPGTRRAGFGVGVGLDDTMVRMHALRNEPDPEHQGNYLVQLEFDYNDALFESPLVSWNPQKELFLFHGDRWTVKLVNRFEERRLK